MFFNPLFIDTTSAGAIQNQKNNVLGKAQYLFSDIIKISLSQNSQAEGELTPMFNLSLVDNLTSISSLFSAINSNAVKSASGKSETGQDADVMLVNFLQFAFINMENPAESAGKVKELMQDKELLLSKESLTKALSQLLQMYQPTANNGVSHSVQTPNAEVMADNILKTIDDKGKAVLNFNNSNSQIKIELTKLNTEEKELFISTKIIPLLNTVTKQAAEKEISKLQGSEINNGNTENTQLTPPLPIKNINVMKDNSAAAGAAPEAISAVQNTKTAVEGILKEAKLPDSAKPETEIKPVKMENQNELKAAVQTDKPVTMKESLNAGPAVPEARSEKKEGKTAPVQQTKTDEYKMKVVEVNTGSETAQAQNEKEKNYELTPFEKNILKKTQITFTSGDTSAKKETSDIKTSNQAAKSIDTVARAEKEILKTNNMLFEEKAGGAEVAKPAVITEGEEPAVKKELQTENNTAPDLKGAKNSSKQAKAEIKEMMQQPNGEINVKQEKTAIKSETEEKGKQSKSVKQSAPDDAPMKGKEIRAESAESKPETGKKFSIENDGSNSGSDAPGGQSQQGAGDKKGSEQKQFTMPAVADKEHPVNFKDETVLREQAKQADFTKTVKTYEIIKEIKSFIEQGNRSSMTLKILPENLGSVKVSLDMVNNMVQARIDVDSENVRQFVQTNLDSLKQTLVQSGVNVSTLQVNVSSSDQKQPRFAAASKRKGNFGKALDLEEEGSASAKKIMGYNSYDYIA